MPGDEEPKKRLEAIQNEIYKLSFSLEQSAFEKLTGKTMYSNAFNDNDSEESLTSLINNSSWKPDKGLIYNLNYMQAMQSGKNGILITGSKVFGMNLRNAFLYTSKGFVDGESLDGYYAYYTGNYKYQSNSGVRNVFAFKMLEMTTDQKLAGKQFYFYPLLLDSDVSESDAKLILGL